jgi:hypothetical protein
MLWVGRGSELARASAALTKKAPGVSRGALIFDRADQPAENHAQVQEIICDRKPNAF